MDKTAKGQVYAKYASQDRLKIEHYKEAIRREKGGAVSIATGSRSVRFDSAEITVYCIVARYRLEAPTNA